MYLTCFNVESIEAYTLKFLLPKMFLCKYYTFNIPKFYIGKICRKHQRHLLSVERKPMLVALQYHVIKCMLHYGRRAGRGAQLLASGVRVRGGRVPQRRRVRAGRRLLQLHLPRRVQRYTTTLPSQGRRGSCHATPTKNYHLFLSCAPWGSV